MSTLEAWTLPICFWRMWVFSQLLLLIIFWTNFLCYSQNCSLGLPLHYQSKCWHLTGRSLLQVKYYIDFQPALLSFEEDISVYSYIIQWFVLLYTNLLVFASCALLSPDVSRFRAWVEHSRYPWAGDSVQNTRGLLKPVLFGWLFFKFPQTWSTGFRCVAFLPEKIGHSSHVWLMAPAFSLLFVSTGSFYLTTWPLVLTIPVASDYRINAFREFIYLVSPVCRTNPFSLSSCTL